MSGYYIAFLAPALLQQHGIEYYHLIINMLRGVFYGVKARCEAFWQYLAQLFAVL